MKSLGFHLGRRFASRLWGGPVGKWRDRARVIAASGAPVGVAAQLESWGRDFVCCIGACHGGHPSRAWREEGS